MQLRQCAGAECVKELPSIHRKILVRFFLFLQKNIELLASLLIRGEKTTLGEFYLLKLPCESRICWHITATDMCICLYELGARKITGQLNPDAFFASPLIFHISLYIVREIQKTRHFFRSCDISDIIYDYRGRGARSHFF